MSEIIPQEIIEQKIHLIRGRKVMPDRDLADLYCVETKTLNQAVQKCHSAEVLNVSVHLRGDILF